MKTNKILSFIMGIAFLLLSSGIGNATAPVAGEEALFTTSTSPDALILMDLSGSMDWNPAGDDKPYGSSSSCTANTANCTGSGCSGGFCGSSKTNCSINCSRLAIAKRAIFDILDDNDDGTINASDEGSLGVRVGYMRFYNCSSDDTGGSYTSGCISIPGSSSSRRYIDSKYSLIYCSSSSSCTITSGSSSSYCVNGESASGGTPLASAMNEAKIYLDAHKAADNAAACRQKFVIFVTDGSDTFSCGGSGAECDSQRYKNRRETVAKAKALADAGYKVFVIGFGSTMPSYLQNTLNWSAYYGGTDNPNATNSTITTAYDPSLVTSCATDASTHSSDNSAGYPYCVDSSGNNNISNFYATANDPGTMTVSGYAFLAADADQLATAMKTAINIIREATYSFSQASVQSSRTADENFLYEGSFQPVPDDPFWLGHLRRYAIDANGEVSTTADWDAGTVLQSRDYSTRTIKTYTGGALVEFNTTNMTTTLLGLPSTDTAERDAVVGYFQGNPAYNPDNWKLGDVFRSTPITVGTPSAFFDDVRDANNAFATHRTDHPRTSALGNRLIVAGANDGQFHTFRTSDGSEAWSFIPPNLLSKLKNISHSTHPTSLTHQYFVDGPVTVADAWLGSGDGTGKNASDWKTILVFGEGRGSTDRLWSSSAYCESGFETVGGVDVERMVGNYDSTHTNYCGFYALDITSSLSPTYLWHINTFNASTQAPYMGDSWSKMMVGRVRINVSGSDVEKWVGFIGAGYNGGDCSGGGACDTRGKGFFVIDLTDGSVLWSYTRYDNTNMKYSMPAQPAIVDTDNDGFIDTVYVGDLGENMWRFKFCSRPDPYSTDPLKSASCGTSNWVGGLFFDSAAVSGIRPIYTSAAVTKDTAGNLWVYWGTGDKTDPTSPSAQERFFGVKDNDRTSTYGVSDLENLVSGVDLTYDPTSTTKVGYYIGLPGHGEKILADPTVFGGVVYFTTYTPAYANDPCEQSGLASLYAVQYATGGGALSGGARSMSVGAGIPSAPVLSLKPGSGGTADLYVTVSGGGSTGSSTSRVNMNPPGASNRTNMLYWLDRRLQ